MDAKPRLAVHKFSSCDGCQLAFLNLGVDLLKLARIVDIVHFAEAGPVAPAATVDIAFVEGSISTPEDEERIRLVRKNSRYLVTIGACATAGGLQALRNRAVAADWIAEIYPRPEFIKALPTSTPVAAHVPVDEELWGCPVTGRQVLAAVRGRLFGVGPAIEDDKVCLECKRRQAVCVLVTRGAPCMGPVTRTGCGALCPHLRRDCYACYGPAENPNTQALGQRLADLGLSRTAIARRFLSINNAAPVFRDAGTSWQGDGNGDA
ncbi:MAG: NADH-quinone oxidoreductase subunit B family protein [Acidiferrobacter thiooxydans]|jgi:coenzyme F420-reducing hydrogenase gamma subunit